LVGREVQLQRRMEVGHPFVLELGFSELEENEVELDLEVVEAEVYFLLEWEGFSLPHPLVHSTEEILQLLRQLQLHLQRLDLRHLHSALPEFSLGPF